MGFKRALKNVPVGLLGQSGSSHVVYDDLPTNIGQVVRPGGSDPTWRTYNLGIGGGVAFSVLGFAVGNYVDFWIQSTHGMALNSILHHHMHWIIPSDDATKKFQFQLDVAAAAKNTSFAAVTGSPFTAEHTLDGTESTKHSHFDLATIPAVNTTVSTAYALRLTRIAASSLEYGAEVYLLFSDSHIKMDTIGTLQEAVKG